METIQVKAEFLFELNSKKEWIRRIPDELPKKIRGGEQWIWIDKNGYVFEVGRDFSTASKLETYPCKVYRVCNVTSQLK